MKTIGVLGGMAAPSTALYFERLNAGVRARLGGQHNADLLVRCIDFADVEPLQHVGDWAGIGRRLNAEARRLEAGGAELLILATNTMHRVADAMLAGVSIPFLHIGDATAAAVRETGGRRPGLLGTAFTMEQAFYRDRLRAAGLEPVIPPPAARAVVHRIIYEELVQGVVTAESRAAYTRIAADLLADGADGVILGCTEIGLLLDASNVGAPVFDTTRIHCERALTLALG